jgi:hypothetical protein
MLTYKCDKNAKRKLVEQAAALSWRVSDNDKHHGREKLYWSQRTWCQAPYVCQKGEDCDHRFYADQVGVPLGVAYAERALFLELPTSVAKTWSSRFLSAIPVGVDLDEAGVFRDFALYLLADPVNGAIAFADNEKQHEAISRVIALFEEDCEDLVAWEGAEQAARKASWSDRFDDNSSEPKEVRAKAGRQACSTADYLCRAFKDPRYAAEAVQWSAWAHRYRVKAEYTARRLRETGEDCAWVYAGTGESRGEQERFRQYERIAEVLIDILKRSDKSTRLGRFFAALVA